MRFEKKLFLAFSTALAGLVLAGCFSLAGDITPPPNYVASTVLPTNPAGGQAAMGSDASATPQPTSQEAVYPLVPPDPADGAKIYAKECLPCHGLKGMGDGDQASQLPNQPPAIGSAELARQSRPADWYNIVTNGNMKQFMPPFSQALSDRQRWDVLAYVYTLSSTSTDIRQGKALYEQNCVECHGVTGQGDGAKAASLSTQPVAWSKDQSRLAQLSAEDIVQVLQNGQGEMPAYQDKLNQAQSYQVAAYIRSLSFSSETTTSEASTTGTPASGASAEVTAQPGVTPTGTVVSTASISGAVSNGTPGGTLPSGLKATLTIYSGMNLDSTVKADVSADGKYTFQDVKVDANYIYIVSVEANGVSFNSDVLHGSDITSSTVTIPVKIYDPSTNTSGLTVDRLHVFFDFSTSGVVQVVNLYIITNPSDHVIVQSENNKPVVSFDLPKGATNLKFQDGEMGGRFVQTANGFGDTEGIPPGASVHQVLFAYDLPYNNKLSLALQSPLPVDAAIVMVPPGVTLNSSQLSDAGQQDVQGTSIHMFQAKSSLKAGEALNLSLSGTPGVTATTAQNSLNYLLIGLGGFGLVLVAVGVWLFTRQRKAVQKTSLETPEGDLEHVASDTEESSEALLDDIVALDDLHASGDLPDAAYHERRASLKARLSEALAREKGNS